MLCIIYLSYCFVIAVEFYKEEYPIDLNQWLDLHRMNMIINISFVVIKNVSLFDCRWKMHDREKKPKGMVTLNFFSLRLQHNFLDPIGWTVTSI